MQCKLYTFVTLDAEKKKSSLKFSSFLSLLSRLAQIKVLCALIKIFKFLLLNLANSSAIWGLHCWLYPKNASLYFTRSHQRMARGGRVCQTNQTYYEVCLIVTKIIASYTLHSCCIVTFSIYSTGTIRCSVQTNTLDWIGIGLDCKLVLLCYSNYFRICKVKDATHFKSIYSRITRCTHTCLHEYTLQRRSDLCIPRNETERLRS